MKAKVLILGLFLVLIASVAAAQMPPRLMRYSGVVKDAQGQPRTGVVTLTFAIYRDADGGAPLWMEAQVVALDKDGRYNAVLGITLADGLPLELFTTGEPRWLGVSVDGLTEQARALLVSVPYALKAADADTIGGRPISAFVLVDDANRADRTDATSTGDRRAASSADTTSLVGARKAEPRTGTGAAPQAASAGTVSGAAATAAKDGVVGGMAVQGPGATATSPNVGEVMYKAAEAWSDTAHGTYLALSTTGIGGTTATERVRVDSRGYVGIGTATPSAPLHVAGDASIDGNIAAKYQDVAEWVPSNETLEAGTVVVVDRAANNGVRAARGAYDVRVAGAVSAKPGLILGEKAAGKVLVAQSGRVRIKADARYGAIKAGDLLVTSPAKGYAMRSKPIIVNGVRVHRPGTILGKALEPLTKGRGEILVLLTLQ